MNDCSPNPCQNGGTCTENVAGFTCECAVGYDGDNCERSKFTCKCIISFNELKDIELFDVLSYEFQHNVVCHSEKVTNKKYENVPTQIEVHFL